MLFKLGRHLAKVYIFYNLQYLGVTTPQGHNDNRTTLHPQLYSSGCLKVDIIKAYFQLLVANMCCNV